MITHTINGTITDIGYLTKFKIRLVKCISLLFFEQPIYHTSRFSLYLFTMSLSHK